MPPKKNKETSFDELNRTLSEGLSRAAKSPNIWGYKPHAKQVKFHQSNAKGRLYIGGNRSGKTVGGVNEDIWWLTGKHPYKQTPEPPIRSRIVGVDFDYGVEQILKPQFAKWLPPSALINGSWEDSYNKGLRLLTLDNGSTAEFMSYVQETKKFAGTSRHFIHFDEEPPKSIFTECKARLVDTAGSWWITETPVEGMTWVYDDIFIPGIKDPTGGIAVIQVDISENPYISTVEIEEFLSGLDDLEKQARGQGKFVHLGGLIFKSFNTKCHVVDPIRFESLKHLTQWASMDHGLNNPTAWHWHAIYPNGSIVTFDEHYEAGLTVSQHSQFVHTKNAEHGRPPNYYVGDPAIKQRNAETGLSIQVLYQRENIPIALANNDVLAGINKMNDYLLLDELGQPTWTITQNCPHLIWQMQRYRWKIWDTAKQRDKNNPREEPHKKDEHAIDDCRYFFSFMPDMILTNDKKPDRQAINARNARLISAHDGYDPGKGRVDTNLTRPDTDWHEAITDEIGEY